MIGLIEYRPFCSIPFDSSSCEIFIFSLINIADMEYVASCYDYKAYDAGIALLDYMADNFPFRKCVEDYVAEAFG